MIHSLLIFTSILLSAAVSTAAQPLGIVDFEISRSRIFMIMEDNSLRYADIKSDDPIFPAFGPDVTAWIAKNKFSMISASSYTDIQGSADIVERLKSVKNYENLFVVTQSGTAHILSDNKVIPISLPRDFDIKSVHFVRPNFYFALSTSGKVRSWTTDGSNYRVPSLVNRLKIHDLWTLNEDFLVTAITRSGKTYSWNPKGQFSFTLNRVSNYHAFKRRTHGADFQPKQYLMFEEDKNTGCALSTEYEVRCNGRSPLNGGYERKSKSLNVPAFHRRSKRRPVLLGRDFRPVQLVANAANVCALSDQGQIKCWGKNTSGELGIGSTGDRGATTEEMGDALPTVDLGRHLHAVQLKARYEAFCALLNNGALKCWGLGSSRFISMQNGNVGDEPGEMGDTLPFVVDNLSADPQE